MRISTEQQGSIVQAELAKFAMMGSDGEIEVNPALTDDDGRDLEIHRRRTFAGSLAVQVKSSLKLEADYRHLTLACKFLAPKNQRRSSPLYWFFFAYLDPRQMSVSDPCFLVPSGAFYRLAPSQLTGHYVAYQFHASMSPTSRDKWSRYQVETRHIGRRLLAILSTIEKREREMEILLTADLAAA